MKQLVFNLLAGISVVLLIVIGIGLADQGYILCKTVDVHVAGVSEAFTLQRCNGTLSVVKEEIDFQKFIDSAVDNTP